MRPARSDPAGGERTSASPAGVGAGLREPGTERIGIEQAGPRAELIRRRAAETADVFEAQRIAKRQVTLTLKRRIVETRQASADYFAAGMYTEARLADQLADMLEERL